MKYVNYETMVLQKIYIMRQQRESMCFGKTGFRSLLVSSSPLLNLSGVINQKFVQSHQHGVSASLERRCSLLRIMSHWNPHNSILQRYYLLKSLSINYLDRRLFISLKKFSYKRRISVNLFFRRVDCYSVFSIILRNSII